MGYRTVRITRRAFVAGMAAGTVLGAGAPFALARQTPRRAPQWDIAEWINGPGGNVDTLRGKVIVIDFFQLWCPGCIQFSIPLMTRWEKEFAPAVEAGHLAFVSIHTVFEGHGYQNPKRLRRFLKEKGIRHPVGVDKHRPGDHVPQTMRRYGTRGTPEMAIIDKAGMIRFQRFGYFEPDLGASLIRRLLAE